MAMAAKIPMMATTTSSSINVKPLLPIAFIVSSYPFLFSSFFVVRLSGEFCHLHQCQVIQAERGLASSITSNTSDQSKARTTTDSELDRSRMPPSLGSHSQKRYFLYAVDIFCPRLF